MRKELIQEFENLREINQINMQRALDQGKKVVGMYCTFAPQELVLAAGAIPVGLCGTNEKPIPAAEKDLPRNLCALIKSSYGFGITDTCPYFNSASMIIGETTCDGKKKMFELMKELKPVHVMSLPPEAKTRAALEMWKSEMIRAKEAIEKELGVEITEEKIRDAIKLINKEKRTRKALYDINQNKPALLAGTDMLKAAWLTTFASDKNNVIEMLDNLKVELEKLAEQGDYYGDEKTLRILLTGTPVGLGSEKVVRLVEECGGNVVCLENCTGYKVVDVIVPEDPDRNVYDLLAETYIQMPCSVMSDNDGRINLLTELVSKFQVDGIIDLSWQACHTYNIEAHRIEKLAKEELALPYLHIETDYSTSDVENLKVRIAAFLEMLQ
ncbi:MAG: 2-hydroxyacyl-CoA dehydratase [Clostridia bacterium]|nr:2-hydroxyacyl-CoA dehydratase [Clostridia bacterium]